LQSKTDGVEVAINEINEMVEQTETNNTVTVAFTGRVA
jgi:hypothetical protein